MPDLYSNFDKETLKNLEKKASIGEKEIYNNLEDLITKFNLNLEGFVKGVDGFASALNNFDFEEQPVLRNRRELIKRLLFSIRSGLLRHRMKKGDIRIDKKKLFENLKEKEVKIVEKKTRLDNLKIRRERLELGRAGMIPEPEIINVPDIE